MRTQSHHLHHEDHHHHDDHHGCHGDARGSEQHAGRELRSDHPDPSVRSGRSRRGWRRGARIEEGRNFDRGAPRQRGAGARVDDPGSEEIWL